MIPNVFISSTIKDLHYLRDAIRDLVKELGYRPIMSEYGDIGYIELIRLINPTTTHSKFSIELWDLICYIFRNISKGGRLCYLNAGQKAMYF
ncbi:DUF4062 domain-containing protein, partial [bacterium]|nr:DUF4062 domain-containing protein [bacterium]